MHALLDIRDLCVRFGEGADAVYAVDGIDLQIHAGETVALVGESGSGKSVTAMSLARLNPEPPTRYPRGRILFNGRSMLKCSRRELQALRGGSISYIFQDPATSLNPVLPVGAQVMEAIRLHRPKEPAREEALRLLDIVGIPQAHQRMKAYPHELSGGMQQRVMIAMALSSRPRLLVADEPTTALDVTIQQQILRLLRRVQERYEMAVLFITHNLALVSELADRVYVMNQGRIVEQGTTEQVLHHPQVAYTRRLLEAVPRLGSVQPGFYQSMEVVSEGASKRGKVVEDSAQPLIQVNDLAVSFGRGKKRVDALCGVSLDIEAGSSVALVGESGSGKTTLGRCVMGMQKPGAGELLFEGQSLQTFSAERMKRYRTEVQMVFQDPYGSLNPRLTIGAALTEVMRVHRICSPDRCWIEAAQWLEKVGLDAKALNRYPHEFSGGQRQRIVIARALTLQPRVLVADEPVSALDVSIQRDILRLLKRLQEELDLTLIFISHDLAVVRHLCDWVHVMIQGEIVEQGSPERVYREPAHAYTQTLLSAVPSL